MIDLSKVISGRFEKFVEKTFKNYDIKQFLLRHERRQLFEKNLKEQLYKSYHVVNSSVTFDNLVEDCSKMFCKVAIEAKEKELRGNKIT